MISPTPDPCLSTRTVKVVAIALAGWLTFLCVTTLLNQASGKDRDSLPRAVETLKAAKQALAEFRATTGNYPDSGGQWLATTPQELELNLKNAGGTKGFANCLHPWPGKPERTMLYRSDGKDYKLIWHKIGDCTDVHASRPDLVDPARTVYSRSIAVGCWEATSPDEVVLARTRPPALKFDPEVPNPLFGECWAYGIWTEGARFW